MGKTTEADRNAERADMRAIAAGDQAAFARLIGREAPRLLRFIQGVLGSVEEAEDVVQDTLTKLWEVAETWRPDARIGTWLHTVAYNRAVDRLRRRRDFADESVLAAIPDASDPADDRIMKGEQARSVHEALARLPHAQRTAILLFHFQELSQAEAASVLGVSERALESLLARARRQLREWLSDLGDELG